MIAAEPLPDRQLALGLLTASAFGPPGIATSLLGIGLFVGVVDDLGAVVPSLAASAVFLATLLLVSRTTINVLGLFTSRYPRWGQLTIGLVSLAFYGSFQFAPQAFARLELDEQRSVASIVRLSPAGQVGEAFAAAGSAPLVALGHALLGAIWLPVLAWVFIVTTRRVLLSSGSSASCRRVDPVGIGPAGIDGAARCAAEAPSVRSRGGAFEPGCAIPVQPSRRSSVRASASPSCSVPALTRDEPGASAVLVGGAVQLSVLFMAGNSIGSDGPALGAEILCGLEPEVIVRAKVRSVIIVASPLAAVGPMIAAGVTGEWRYLPAGIAIGIAGLLAGAGGAIVQSTIVPIAVPESDNPLASGDSGNGLLAAMVLVVVLITLTVVTLPAALALVWALTTESVVLVTGLASQRHSWDGA